MIAKRIRGIAKLIGHDESVIDVGCDHGYLALQLRTQGHYAPIICSDNKSGPLMNAKNNLCHMENIDFLLCDGIEKLNRNTDVCVMAGMGNYTIEHILSNEEKVSLVRRFIIQCNTNVPKLRFWLMKNGFYISDELVVHDGKFYQIICAQKGAMHLNEEEIEFGPVLLKNRNSEFLEMLNDRLEKLKTVQSGIHKECSDYYLISKQIESIENVLKRDTEEQ